MKDFGPSPQGGGRAASRDILIAVMLRKALSGSRVRRDQKEQDRMWGQFGALCMLSR